MPSSALPYTRQITRMNFSGHIICNSTSWFNPGMRWRFPGFGQKQGYLRFWPISNWNGTRFWPKVISRFTTNRTGRWFPRGCPAMIWRKTESCKLQKYHKPFFHIKKIKLTLCPAFLREISKCKRRNCHFLSKTICLTTCLAVRLLTTFPADRRLKSTVSY